MRSTNRDILPEAVEEKNPKKRKFTDTNRRGKWDDDQRMPWPKEYAEPIHNKTSLADFEELLYSPSGGRRTIPKPPA